MDYVERYQLQSFATNKRTFNNLNSPNKEIEFNIDVADGFT
jgi:hypothetical protein